MALPENNQIVLISGAPGTGKTISSKMLATQFMLYGHYSLCYSDGEDLHHIKDALSPLPEQKEFIFINAEIAFIQESAEISDYYSNSDVGQYNSLYSDDDDV